MNAPEERRRGAREVALAPLRRRLVEVLGELVLEGPADLLAVRPELLQRLVDLGRQHRLRQVRLLAGDGPLDALQDALRAAVILHGGHRHNLNVRGAFLHVLSDAIGSVGAIVAGLIMLSSGWYLADPLISVFIGALILFSSWSLIKDSLSVLMQAVPKGIRLEEVRETIESVDGVAKVHDLHVWAETSDIYTLSAHAVVENGGDFHEVLNGIEDTLKERFHIEHITIQLETESREDKEYKAF